MARRDSGGGSGKVVAGFLLGILVVVLGAFLYLRYGAPPVATADAPFPFERAIVSVPLDARIARQIKQPPFGTSEEVFEAGAKVYRAQCAACHGTPGHDVAFAKHMYPAAPQLWKKHGSSNVVGVSDDEAGATEWRVENGIRLTGMPAYNHVLSDTEMWDVSLLLKNADQPLPEPVMALLNANSTP